MGTELTDDERYAWLSRYLRETQGDQLIVGRGAVDLSVLPQYETEIVMTIDASKYTINGQVKTLDVPPQLINERTMVPVRFVSEALGAEVQWNQEKQQISIRK